MEKTNMSSFSGPGVHRTASFSRASHLGGSKYDLERDSGFSDASSEYLSAMEVTDSEQAGRNGSMFGPQSAGQQVAVVGGPYPGLSPMIFMNNFVLKQPSSTAPAEKQWGFPSHLEVMPQSQVVLLQPMMPNGSSNSPNPSPENLRQSKNNMPSATLHTQIAPHPEDAATERVASSKLRARSASEYGQRHRRHHRLYSCPSPLPGLQTLGQNVGDFEAAANHAQADEQLLDELSAPQAGSCSLPSYSKRRTVTPPDKYHDAITMHSNKLKRFSNTYNILDKSGLLGIAMRTKQLIKENKRTQGLLCQLQEHTDLLLEALSSGDPHLWTKLQLSLQNTEKAHRVLA
ncbi:CLOCK-interacting pacemaker [Oryzias melastigma]|uniref:CLOCK-interacting pacemaker n=1 Tax=Oryzias melastigma TaxID=30732 RepID=A0A3B3DYY9_ORYME|nr:CLOCK-interacting pacemaker a [Oryzias melastigma]KAF6732943.1 CLOCK-interacting pacemaker [Oryzias melastigma]